MVSISQSWKVRKVYEAESSRMSGRSKRSRRVSGEVQKSSRRVPGEVQERSRRVPGEVEERSRRSVRLKDFDYMIQGNHEV